jgi:hypothetical protein
MVSWMNVADEGSTAHLKAGVQPCATVAQMSAQAALQVVNGCFERWGMPKEIKIDNGHPFVNPNHRDLPTLAKLWWIGLGINVIQNDVGRPQQNGAVECLQGVMGSWSNPGGSRISRLSSKGWTKRASSKEKATSSHQRAIRPVRSSILSYMRCTAPL